MIKIVGTGSYLPEKIVTNFDLEKMVDTSNTWIQERTGISERRVAAKDELNSDMAVQAAKKAIENAKMKVSDIELLIVGTSTPDYTLPAVAPIIQHKLGLNHIPAFDINSVCTSFVYAFMTASSFITSGFYNNCLIIGSDIYSRILNWKDRNTCCIFGDGAGAVIIKKMQGAKGIISFNLGANGEDADLIRIPIGGTKFPAHYDGNYKKEDYYFQMAGTDVYEFTIHVIPQIASELIKKANLNYEDIDWFLLHQANRRIIESVSKRLKIPLSKFIVNIEKVGNTSAASIPIALDEAIQKGKVKDHDKIMMIGFGGGLSWGGMILEM
jgi:3-oxoacyl-[acyl-carrier-protein] synthase III